MRLPRHFVPRNDESESFLPIEGEGKDEGENPGFNMLVIVATLKILF